MLLSPSTHFIHSFIHFALLSSKATMTGTSKRTSCCGGRAFGPPSPPKKGGNWSRKKKVDELPGKLENYADDVG